MALEELNPNVSAASTPSLRSSAVRGMLRTTTELGDTGPFAVKPSRIPRSGSRVQSTRHRSGSFDTSFASQLRHQRSPRRRRSYRKHGIRPVPSSSGLSGRETIRSNPIPQASGLRSKRAGNRHRSQALQGLTAVEPHILHTHRSLVTLRGHRDVQSLHSASPMIHPGQGRRQPYRTSSPAFSETRSFGQGFRPGYPRVGSAGTVGSSPASMFPARPGMHGYRSELNNSISSFGRLPSPVVSSMNSLPVNGYPTQRIATPMSMSLQNFRRTSNNSAASFRALPKSPIDSTTPRYYDYSESFVDEERFSPANGRPETTFPLTMDQAILDHQLAQDRRHAQSPFGTLAGSTFYPAELPTKHNRRSSEQSKHSYAGVIPPRKSSLAATTTPLKSVGRDQKSLHRPASVEQEDQERHSREDKDGPRTSTASRRTCGSPHASAFFPNATRSPRDLTTLAARVHSPVLEEKPPTRSISKLMKFRERPDVEGVSKTPNDECNLNSRWELPSFTFRPLSFVSHASEVRDRPKTSNGAASRQGVEILSPMPERPMSSQSRKRFSRIFEIEANYSSVRKRSLKQVQAISKLSAVEERPDIPSFVPASARLSELDGNVNISIHEPQQCHYHLTDKDRSNAHTQTSRISIHDRSTVESLLDSHIKCLGLNEDGGNPFEADDDSAQSDNADDSSAESTVKLSSMTREASKQSIRPMTSSSCQHSSLASWERRKLMPRRLFASMDSRLPSGGLVETIQGSSLGKLSSATSTVRQLSPGWHTLPSTNELISAPSTAKASLTSGDLGDVDSDPPLAKFKIRRRSELSTSVSVSSNVSPDGGEKSRSIKTYTSHRRSKSDVLARHTSHQRRRMRILIKTKRKSTSLGQLANLKEGDLLKGPGLDEDWSTEESSGKPCETSPVAGYAELSADSVVVHPPTTASTGTVLLSTSGPRRWTSMLAAMPEPVRKGIGIVRNASVRTVQTHRSNASVIEPMNSTRQSSQIPRLGSVPQLAPPEFGPPLTSSDINLSLRFPGSVQITRPPLREAQSFFSDDSSAQPQRNMGRKRFDLHSLRGGLTKSSGLLGAHQSAAQNLSGDLKLSHSCQLKGQRSFEYPQSGFGDTVPMSDFAFKRRKVVERVKDWWKRQCMQKTLTFIKQKTGKSVHQRDVA